MKLTPPILLSVIILSGCQVDVSLGQVPIEVAEDAGTADVFEADAATFDVVIHDSGIHDSGIHDTGTADVGFPSGNRLLVLANAEVSCGESFAGREGDFATVTPTAVGLAGGPIEVVFPTGTSSVAQLSGPALFDSFGVSSVWLEEFPDPEAPPGFLGTVIPIDGVGPLGTVRRSALIAVDVSPGAVPLDGILGVELGDVGSDGFCLIQFQLVISPT